MVSRYVRAHSIEEALRLHREEAGSVFLAGGTEIGRLGSSVDAKSVISLRDLPLHRMEADERGVRIGAMVSFSEALESPLSPPFLREALRFMGSATKRNMATVGGNVALSSDSSYLMCSLLAARARVTTAFLSEEGTYGEENLPLREYSAYHGQYANSLVLEIVLPPLKRFVASARFSRTVESQSSVVCSFGSERGRGSLCDHVRMYAALKGSGILRFKATENLLEQGSVTREEFQSMLSGECPCVSDITGSAQYKSYIVVEALWQMYRRFLKEDV